MVTNNMEFALGNAKIKTGSFILGVVLLGAILLASGEVLRYYYEEDNIGFALISTGGLALLVFGVLDVIMTILRKNSDST